MASMDSLIELGVNTPTHETERIYQSSLNSPFDLPETILIAGGLVIVGLLVYYKKETIQQILEKSKMEINKKYNGLIAVIYSLQKYFAGIG